MRLLRVEADGVGGEGIDLHPMVTVITGLGPEGRARIARTVQALATGAEPGCRGLVEAHGVLFDLTRETLELFGLASDLDVVVRAGDVPGAARQAPPVATVRPTVEQFLAETPEGTFPELDEARQRHRDAEEALAVLREAAERARAELARATERRRTVEAALEAAQRVPATGGSPPARSAAEVAERRAELEEELGRLDADLARIERGLAELSAIDTRPIQVLLEAIRDPAPVELVPSERAAELADRFVTLQKELAELEDVMEAEGRGPTTAIARLEQARAEVAAAEKAMAKPELSPQDVEELEAAHEAVLEAEAKVSGRLGRRHLKRLEEARAREQEILDRVGFPTWSAYVMGANLMSIDPMAEVRLEKARLALEEAEAHWALVSAALEADPEHRRLLDELEALEEEALELLGGEEPDDLEAALRNLKVPRREVSPDELVDALAYQLELVGLELPPQAGEELVLVAADAFLEEAAGINDRIAELQAEREEVERRRSAVATELAELPEPGPDLDLIEPVIDLTERADDGEPGEGAEDERVRLEAELVAAEADERDAAETVEAREALLDAATQVEAVARSRLLRIAAELVQRTDGGAPTPGARPSSEPAFDVDDAAGADAGPEAIEFYLLARLAAQRNVSFVGSVPLVIDDALADVGDEEVVRLLDKLERMSEAVQILYLSDDRRIADWARSVGIERAAVVAAPAGLA